MPPSQQVATPVVIAVARPISQSMDGTMKAVGVAAKVTTPDGSTRHWMSGYAKSDDQARCAMIQHLLTAMPGTHLVVWSASIETLKHVPGARLNGGMRSGKNKKVPFAAFALFDPVEAALRDGRWSLQTFGKGEEPSGYDDAQRIAERALWVAKSRTIEFPAHRAEHPDWHMLEVGLTENPVAEYNARAR